MSPSLSSACGRGALGLGAALVVVALGACGSSGGPRSQTTGATSGAAGYTSFSDPHYSLAVPTNLNHSRVTGSGGRVVNAWTDPIGAFTIEAIYDPHPASLAQATRAAVDGARTGYRVARLSVSDLSVPGASAAKLVSNSGHETRSPATPESGAELNAVNHTGASVEVLVFSRGADNPDPVTVVKSLKLTG